MYSSCVREDCVREQVLIELMGTSFWVRGTKTPGHSTQFFGGYVYVWHGVPKWGSKELFFFLQKNKVYGTENFSFNI